MPDNLSDLASAVVKPLRDKEVSVCKEQTIAPRVLPTDTRAQRDHGWYLVMINANITAFDDQF